MQISCSTLQESNGGSTMTQCALRERERFYSTSVKKTYYGYKKTNMVNKAVLDYLTSLDIPKSQAYFWTRDWISAEKSADEDIKNNRLHVSKTAEEIIEYLNSPD